MKIGILGTGMVGEALGTALVAAGHTVVMGSRTATNEKALAWAAKVGAGAAVGTFADAAAKSELLLNCTKGMVSLDALALAGEANLNGKVLVDVANPLDFSHGMPPSLSVCNTDSLGEQIQRAFPDVRVVKALNTMSATLMVNPKAIAGVHHLFMCGNDATAKADVKALLQSAFGWSAEQMIDLGDITHARGTEMLLPIWVRLWGALKTPMFNFAIVK